MSGRRPRARPAAPRLLEVRIERLGAAGDGEGVLDGRRVFVPLTLPGERWRVRLVAEKGGALRAETVERLDGPARATPICPHFGSCGGCTLQHLPAADYAAFKHSRVVEPLRRVGLVPGELRPIAVSPPGSRRRLRLAFTAASAGAVRLGFRARASRTIAPVTRCPVARPELEALLLPLASALEGLGLVRRAGAGDVVATHFEAGVDLLLLVDGSPDLADRERLAALAETLDLARLALARPGSSGEPLVVRRPPLLRLGPVAVEPPPGVFLQATEEGERALRAAIAEWIPDGTRLLDLYAGLGALSLPDLARLSRLELIEGQAEVVAAASRALAGRPRVRVVRRDLARDPLRASELAGFDAVLLDPPRAGAAPQCSELARSTVERIVYASCDPGSFARDARILAEGGFTLAALQPIDQFLFSAEIELVALFLRGPRPLPRPPAMA